MSKKYYSTLGPLKVGETRTVTFDFSSPIGKSADVIASATIDVQLIAGTDPTLTDTLVGSHSIDGPYVLQLIKGGVMGATYLYTCTATLSPSAQVPIVSVQILTVPITA